MPPKRSNAPSARPCRRPKSRSARVGQSPVVTGRARSATCSSPPSRQSRARSDGSPQAPSTRSAAGWRCHLPRSTRLPPSMRCCLSTRGRSGWHTSVTTRPARERRRGRLGPAGRTRRCGFESLPRSMRLRVGGVRPASGPARCRDRSGHGRGDRGSPGRRRTATTFTRETEAIDRHPRPDRHRRSRTPRLVSRPRRLRRSRAGSRDRSGSGHRRGQDIGSAGARRSRASRPA